jgi:hypothetical protein
LIAARNWRPLEKNTLRGFVDLELPDPGLVIRSVCLHAKAGSRWVAMPARPWIDESGTRQWTQIVEFANPDARRAFQAAALRAIDEIMDITDK